MIENLYIIAAYGALVSIFTFCGVLRLCNLWPQSTKPVAELYPARHIVSCIYFAVLLLLPCALHPYSYDARLLARCFWIFYIPTAASLAFKRFFYGDSLHKQLRIMVVGGVPLAATLALSIIAFAGGDLLLPYTKTVIRMASFLGVLLTAYLLHVVLWLFHIISNPDDRHSDEPFPRHFACGILTVTIFALGVAWCDFLWGNLLTNTILAATVAFAGAVIVLIILHPQRVAKETVLAAAIKDVVDVCVNEKEKAEDTPQETVSGGANKYKLSDSQLDNMEQRVRELVEGEKLYLDPNLKLDTLGKKLNVNRSYLSEIFARRFGSLSGYLRSLRMEEVVRYIAEHPAAKRSEVALNCGFGSENSYYRAKKAYERDNDSKNK